MKGRMGELREREGGRMKGKRGEKGRERRREGG